MTSKTYNLNRRWKYLADDAELSGMTELPASRELADVTLPHENILLENHKSDPDAGVDFMDSINSYRFVSCWFRSLTLTEEMAAGRLFLEFDGAATVAEVYVNGIFAGAHRGAYTGFSVDITDKVHTGVNFIAVRVDSRRHADIPPEGGEVDYCLFGGIVRDVRLKLTPEVFISDVFVTSDVNGSVTVNAEIKNMTGRAAAVKLSAFISYCGAKSSENVEKTLEIAPDSTVAAPLSTNISEDVRLWDIDSPHLYEANVCLECGKIRDFRLERFGVRSAMFTSGESESAFYLNGRKIKLVGINRHEMWAWIGRAVCDKLQRADADLIKSCGFNAVRCSHYPQSPAFLSRCDEIGLLVLEEAPGWQHVGDEQWQKEYLFSISEMIVRDRNHPSIISWGVRVNESFDSRELYDKSNALSKRLDPTRPTHGVRRLESYMDSEFQEDIFAVNYTYPERPRFTPFIITEHSMDWWSGDGFPGADGEGARKFIDSFAGAMDYYLGNNFCAGGFGWSMFDYNNEVNYTKTGHVFYSGLYDIFRYPKPVSYLYRSQKDPNDEEVLYIAGSPDDERNMSDILVLGNCSEVELFMNGKSSGRMRPNLYMNLPHPAFLFRGIACEASELSAVGYRNGAEISRCVRKTPGTPTSLRLTPEYTTLVADGADLTNVWIELVDENGTVLKAADDKIEIEVSGNAEFIGERAIALEGGHAAFMVRSKDGICGEVMCRARTRDGKIHGDARINIIPCESEEFI
ncbi:MAG: DUF4982 domain-containing protein [Firmicutes bacterium]|nr:DUF4982 domain-containing protein [Bacillota bacterium]